MHHLWFDERATIGSDPQSSAIRRSADGDGEALLAAVDSGRIDIIATDHAPHTREEKARKYSRRAGRPATRATCPAAALRACRRRRISPERIVDKACHAPADVFGIADRGYLREGAYAGPGAGGCRPAYQCERAFALYKCGWSPFTGHRFSSSIDTTLVNGTVVFRHGKLSGAAPGRRLDFRRNAEMRRFFHECGAEFCPPGKPVYFPGDPAMLAPIDGSDRKSEACCGS